MPDAQAVIARAAATLDAMGEGEQAGHLRGAARDVVAMVETLRPEKVYVLFSKADGMPMTCTATAELADEYRAAMGRLPVGHLMHTDPEDLEVHLVPLLIDALPVALVEDGKARLYVVPIGRLGDDYAGVLASAGKVWWQHVSSSTSWLARDLTSGTERVAELAAAFPDGYDLVVLEAGAELPPEIAYLFEPAEPS